MAAGAWSRVGLEGVEAAAGEKWESSSPLEVLAVPEAPTLEFPVKAAVCAVRALWRALAGCSDRAILQHVNPQHCQHPITR